MAAGCAGGICVISGQFGTDADNHPVGDVEQQATVALDHLEEVLRCADLNLSDVVRITVWLRDLNDFAAMNRAYRERFPPGSPLA
jgi:2-iminobutanoate/2-iminopropanoate deaminase